MPKMLRDFVSKIRGLKDIDARQAELLKAFGTRDFASALVVCTDIKMLKELVTLLGMTQVRSKQAPVIVKAIRAFHSSYKSCSFCKKKTPSTCVTCVGDTARHAHLGCTLDLYPILAVEYGFPVPGAVDAPRCIDCARSAIITIMKDIPNIKKKIVKTYFTNVLRANAPNTVCAAAVMQHGTRHSEPVQPLANNFVLPLHAGSRCEEGALDVISKSRRRTTLGRWEWDPQPHV